MLHLQRIEDMDQLKGRPHPAPERLLDIAGEADARGEAWWVIEARADEEEEPVWLCVFPGHEAPDQFFRFGDLREGRWDPGQEVFQAEDGACFDLQGRPAFPSAAEDEEEEEDLAWEEEQARRKGGPDGETPSGLDPLL